MTWSETLVYFFIFYFFFFVFVLFVLFFCFYLNKTNFDLPAVHLFVHSLSECINLAFLLPLGGKFTLE